MVESKTRWRALLAAALLTLGACTGGSTQSETPNRSAVSAASSSTVPSSTSSVPPATPSSRSADEGLDLSRVAYVVHGPDGISLEDGTEVWATEPFPTGISRDRDGGIAFTDSAGLWWFPVGAREPTLVRTGFFELISVFESESGPVAMVWNGEPEFVRLVDGESVPPPDSVRVEVSSASPWSRKWTASNGLSAWVNDPVVEFDSEGQPAQIVKPAHLVVAEREEILIDVTLGTVEAAWATIHDFDGRMLIISLGPYEPAMPEETFVIVDLATGGVTYSFIAAGTGATLTGKDVEWSGPVQVLEIGSP